MANGFDFGNEITHLQKFPRRMASGDHDIQIGTPRAERIQHFIKGKLFVVKRDIEFIEDHELPARREELLFRAGPALTRERGVVSRFP